MKHKMNLKMLLVVMLLRTVAHGQSPSTQVTPFSFTTIPPSPQASAMGKYGGLPVNLSTGAPNYTIPLYNKEVNNNISLDLSLNYNTNGIKVEELAGVSGLGWSLFAGGVITRNVNDEPDELSQDLAAPLTTSTQAERNIQWYMDNPLKRVIFYGQSTPFYDIQPDLFSFNFFGHTGQFFLDSGMVYIIDQEDLKIETDWSYATAPWTFKITDQFGNIFLFGGTAATENTQTSNNAQTYNGQLSNWNPSNNFRTAFYITKVITPQRDTVSFDYVTNQYTTISGQTKELISQTTESQGPNIGGQICDCISPTIMMNQTRNVYGYDLKKITINNSLQVDVEHINNPDLVGTQLIKTLKIKDLIFNQSLKEIKFNYQMPASSNRPVLQNLMICDNQGGNCDSFFFGYNNLTNLPARTAIDKMDFYGYFNNNTASRAVDCQQAKTGMLTSIKYPTGGKDDISYGCSQSTSTQNVLTLLLAKYLTGYGTGDHSPVDYTFDFVVPSNAQGFRVYTEAIWHGAGSPTTNYNKVVANIYNKRTHSYCLFSPWAMAPGAIVECGQTLEATASADPGDTLTFYLTPYGADVEGKAYFQYYAPVPQTTTSYYGAAKVEQVTTYDPVSNQSTIKKYLYEYKNNPGVSSGIALNQISTDENYYFRNICPYSSFAFTYKVCRTTLKSNYSQYDLYSYMPSSYLYKSVLEYEGANGEGGITEHIFDIKIPQKPTLVYTNNVNVPNDFNDWFDAPYSLTSGQISREIETNRFKKNGSNLIPVQFEKKWFSVHKNFKERIGYGVKSVDNGEPGGNGQQLDIKGNVKQFSYRSSWTALDSIKSTSFLDYGSPSITTTDFQYQNENHLLPTIIRTNKDDVSENMLLNLYPLDYIGNNDYISTMIAKHIDHKPIEQLNIKKRGTEYVITQGSFNEYSLNVPSALTKKYPLNIQTPVVLSSFKISNRNLGADLYSYVKTTNGKDAVYKNYIENKIFDAYLNPVQTKNDQDEISSYVWGYSGKYLFANVKNSEFSNIAYSSFEDDKEKGNWIYSGVIGSDIIPDQYAPTGSYVYNLAAGAIISNNNLNPTKKYVVSFYYQGPSSPTVTNQISYVNQGMVNNYLYYECIVGNTQNISISFPGANTRIDELRLYPVESVMTTRTFKPSLGITSECDEKGNVTRYEYNGKGQLILTKDRQGSILNKFTYKIQD